MRRGVVETVRRLGARPLTCCDDGEADGRQPQMSALAPVGRKQRLERPPTKRLTSRNPSERTGQQVLAFGHLGLWRMHAAQCS